MSSPLAQAFVQAASLDIAGKQDEALAELCRARDAGWRSPKLFDAIGHLQFQSRSFDAATNTTLASNSARTALSFHRLC